jgi:alpha-2-macroglobulin
LTYLKSVVGLQPSSLAEAEVIAKAIYMLTRREQVTTNQIINLRDTLDRDYPGGWQDSLTGVYLAGSAALLLKEHEANDWIGHYHLHANPTSDTLFSSLKSDAEYLLILARHFPARFQTLSAEQLERVFRPLLVGDYNTISAAECARVLAAAQSLFQKNNLSLKVSEWSNTWHDLPPAANSLTKISPNSTKLKMQSNSTNGYYQVIVQGFPKTLPPASSGIEIQRELLDTKGQTLTHFRVGDDAIVRLRIRSTTGSNVDHVAILDLFAAGYEPVREKGGEVKVESTNIEHDDVRDDRAIFYLTVTPETTELTYRVKMTSTGQFTLPPITAHSMYNLKVQAVGQTGKLVVE